MTPSSVGMSQDFRGLVTTGAAELVADAAEDEMEDNASNAKTMSRADWKRSAGFFSRQW